MPGYLQGMRVAVVFEEDFGPERGNNTISHRAQDAPENFSMQVQEIALGGAPLVPRKSTLGGTAMSGLTPIREILLAGRSCNPIPPSEEGT